MFVGIGRERVDLAELELEQIQLALALRGELAAAPPGVARSARMLRDGARAQLQSLALLGAAEAVEDLQLGRRERELAVLVLAVEGEQHAGDVAQVGDRA